MKDFLQSVKLLIKRILKPDPFLLPVILLAALFFLVVFDVYQKGEIILKSTLNTPITNYKSSSYPFLKNKFNPNILAQAAIVVDKDSGVVIYAKNENLRFSPASTAKIMTALTALDYFKLTDVLEVKRVAGEGSILGLVQGEKMTFLDLLYAMLLPSANDAAFVIAQNYPGEEQGFIEKMNQKVKLLGLNNTHFQDPAGLLDQDNYTTPLELARLASVSLENKLFSQVVSTKYRFISDINGVNTYPLFNRNKLLGIDGISGIKTGFTDEAGGVLVSSKSENGHTLIIVVMRSEDRFGDTLALASYVSDSLTYLSIHP